MIGLILQARMSSRRLPGKVMSQIKGEPLIKHVVSRCRAAHATGPVIVCTSTGESDSPIYEYCVENEIDVFRGSLDDVYGRYLGCIERYQLTAFGRICCDSPGISPSLIHLALNEYRERGNADLVSNVCLRTYPVGQSIEIVNSKTFCSPEFSKEKGFCREHVTQSFYQSPEGYKIFNIRNLNPVASESWGVDEPGDIERLTNLIAHPYVLEEGAFVVEPWG